MLHLISKLCLLTSLSIGSIYAFEYKLEPKQVSEILKELKSKNKLKFSIEKTNSYFYINWKYYKNKDVKYEVKIVE